MKSVSAIPAVLFASVLGMSLLLVAAYFMGERPYEDTVQDGAAQRVYKGHGVDHPHHTAMQQGGDGLARHRHLMWLGWACAMLLVVFLIGALLLGMSKKQSQGPVRLPLIVGGILFAGLFSMVFLTYPGYMAEASAKPLLGFPEPTTWMLLGIWTFPAFFIAFFIFSFDRWYVCEEDLKRFKEILKKHRLRDRETI